MKTLVNVSDLVGKVLVAIVGNETSEKLVFVTENERYEMYHEQDCCECVTIEDITGDLNDLLVGPILMAEEVTNSEQKGYDSVTWTFYKLATLRGNVTIRWYGESNGYYSESVSFYKVTE